MPLLGLLQERWSVRRHPRPYVWKHCFYKINRGDDEAFGETFYRCSYLAKERGKGYGSLGTNNYSGSRVGLEVQFSVFTFRIYPQTTLQTRLPVRRSNVFGLLYQMRKFEVV